MLTVRLLIVFIAVHEPHEPSDQILHHRGVETVDDVLPVPFVGYQFRGFQRGQMVADRWFAHVELFRELTGRHVTFAQQFQNAPSRRIGERFEPLSCHAFLLYDTEYLDIFLFRQLSKYMLRTYIFTPARLPRLTNHKFMKEDDDVYATECR